VARNLRRCAKAHARRACLAQVGVISDTDRKFRVLTPAEIKDYLTEVE
jgi:hypothetical protein